MFRSEDLQKQINALMTKGVNDGVFPGANYALIIENKTLFGSFGNKALVPLREDNNIDTVYDIASLSKAVGTTTAILKLIDDKELSLQSRAIEYLPYVDNDNITIEHLLTHCSGLPAVTAGTLDMKQRDALLWDLQHCSSEYPIGSRVTYSDVGFLYLGFIIDKITGSLAGYIRDNIFKPLGMKDSDYNFKDIKRIAPTEEYGFRGMIRGFSHDEKAFLLDGETGHAGIFSTVGDLSVFARMLLNGGYLHGSRILSEKAIEGIQNKRIKADEESHRSLGWIVRNLGDHEFIYHTGYTGTSMLVDFSKHMSFILLSNRVHPSRDNLKIRAFRKEMEELIYRWYT